MPTHIRLLKCGVGPFLASSPVKCCHIWILKVEASSSPTLIALRVRTHRNERFSLRRELEMLSGSPGKFRGRVQPRWSPSLPILSRLVNLFLSNRVLLLNCLPLPVWFRVISSKVWDFFPFIEVVSQQEGSCFTQHRRIFLLLCGKP